MNRSKKVLSVFNLVMINVIAVDSLRTLPISAEYGFSIVCYYLLAAILFFIPTALIVAELATGWPETGGIYIWLREAFGEKTGFVVSWLQWLYNICWYPTILTLVAATLAYVFDPKLVDNKFYMLTVIMVVFWGATIVNSFGMRASSILSNVTAIIGTLVPMFFISILGVLWLIIGKPTNVHFSWGNFIPNFSSVKNLVLLTAVLYGLIGLEMSATHAKEVKKPSRDYPRALLFSTVIILITLILGSLAIAIVVPAKNLSIVTGLLQAFSMFFSSFHMTWLMPIIGVLIVFGAIGGVSAWIIGPAKCLLAASRDGTLPKLFSISTKNNVPLLILLAQAIIFSIISLVFLLMPTVSSSFWLLTDITAELSLLVYLAMFIAAIVLRYKKPEVKRPFTIPGGKFGIWLVALFGIAATLFAIVIGFFPPEQIPVGTIWRYETILISGIIIGCTIPLIIAKRSSSTN